MGSMDAAHTAKRRGTFFRGCHAPLEPPFSKATLRARVVGVPPPFTPSEAEERGRRAQEHLAAASFFGTARTVALYAALPSEVSTWELMDAARSAGRRVCFPRIRDGAKVLAFLQVDARSALRLGRWGILEPEADALAVALPQIDLFVVPGLAFGSRGERLGRGGGHYDATLAAAGRGAQRVGLAWSHQVIEGIPMEPHDAWMDWVATEDALHVGCPPGRR